MRKLSVAQRAVLLQLPWFSAKYVKGPATRVCQSLAQLGLAERVAQGQFAGGYWRLTKKGRTHAEFERFGQWIGGANG